MQYIVITIVIFWCQTGLLKRKRCWYLPSYDIWHPWLVEQITLSILWSCFQISLAVFHSDIRFEIPNMEIWSCQASVSSYHVLIIIFSSLFAVFSSMLQSYLFPLCIFLKFRLFYVHKFFHDLCEIAMLIIFSILLNNFIE